MSSTPRLPLQSKLPQRPLIAYLTSPVTRKIKLTQFNFAPKQGLHRFYFLFSNNSPRAISVNTPSSARTTYVPSTTKECQISRSTPPTSPLPPPGLIPLLPSHSGLSPLPSNSTLTTQKPSCRSPKDSSRLSNNEKETTKQSAPEL
jgi:hypothetical protein